MSRLTDLLTPRLPEGFAIPEPLDRAWSWMEQRGWVETELDTEVPSVWTVTDPDPFAEWVSQMQSQR